MKSCHDCANFKPSPVYKSGACFRGKEMKSGKKFAAPVVGFSAEYERGHIDIYEGRLESDHCGPDGIHWEGV